MPLNGINVVQNEQIFADSFFPIFDLCPVDLSRNIFKYFEFNKNIVILFFWKGKTRIRKICKNER